MANPAEIEINKGSITYGKLWNTKVQILLDSKAPSSIIKLNCIPSEKLDLIKTAPLRDRVHNTPNGKIYATGKLMLDFETECGTKFKFDALVTDQLIGYDMILGKEEQRTLENTVGVKRRSPPSKGKQIPIYANSKTTIRPGQSTMLKVWGNLPLG